MNKSINLAKVLVGLIGNCCITGMITGSDISTLYGQQKNEVQKIWQGNSIGYPINNQKNILLSRVDFYNYARIRDDDYAEYLKETWHDYSIYSPLSAEPQKNIGKQPVFNYSGLEISLPVNLPFSSVIGINDNGKNHIKSIPRIRKPESGDANSEKRVFQFYGQQINLNFDRLIILSPAVTVSEDSVSVFWQSFSRSNSNHMVDQLMDYRDLLGLNDWGYFQLVKATSNKLFPDNLWCADQLTWALMVRSGFDVRLAFNQNSTTVLFPSENNIFEKQFIMIGQKRFYLDRKMNTQLLVTCQKPFPDTDRMIDLYFYKSLNFNGKLNINRVSVLWKNKEYEFKLRVNPESIRFYNEYPSTDPSVYFGAPVSSIFKDDLFAQLYPFLSKLNKIQATLFLQQFIQQKIVYSAIRTEDKLKFSRFPEAILAERTGDSNSKTVLFSSLVRTLLRLQVVGVRFPGYFSAAVSFDEPFDGEAYNWKQRKYTITDPTYLNAPIGVIMPEFSGLIPQLIDLSEPETQMDKAIKIWNIAFKLGARRGGANQDFIDDQSGKALITGYFPIKNSNYPFIASFSEGNSLQWIRKFEGDGKAVAFAIKKVSEDEIYIAGSFNGKLVFDGKTIQSKPEKWDLFIAQFNQNGELIWMKNAGSDQASFDGSLAYIVRFDRSGAEISCQWINEDERNIKTGFGDVSEDGLFFTGSVNLTPGLVPALGSAMTSGNYHNHSDLTDAVIKNKYNAGIDNFISKMKLLMKPGTAFTGNRIQSYFVPGNSSFAIKQKVFDILGHISIVKNTNGISLLRTIDHKPLLFKYLRIEDGARFNISVCENGDISIGVISGLQLLGNHGGMPLNNILIDESTGYLLLDYDYDHTMKTGSLESLLSAI
ncbi:MAG: hypothetical protein WCL21_13120 [Mariniphaga sp.]